VEFRGDDLNDESKAAIAVLQERWPAAFPKEPELVRPLMGRGVVAAIAESTGWSKRYTKSALSVWKRRPTYSQAVLRCERRYDLNGAASDERVSEQARARATERLAQAQSEESAR
jgi:sRNA-binding protein